MGHKNVITLSDKAKSIVDAYFNNDYELRLIKELVIELYSRKKEADKDLVALSRSEMGTCSISLSKQEYAVLDAEYNEVVKYCHKIIITHNGTVQPTSGNLYLPSELVELCSKIIKSTREDTIFLPYAGNCDIAFALNLKSVSGFDNKLSTVAFSRSLFDAYGISGGISYYNSFVPENRNDEQYKHVISCPPFLASKDDGKIAQYMLDILQNRVADEGDMCLILPLETLTTMPWYNFRRHLFENNKNYKVLTISLPSICTPIPGIQFSVMFIEKKDNPEGIYSFMDADRQEFYSNSKESSGHHLKDEAILETLSNLDNRYIRKFDVTSHSSDNPYEYSNYSFVPSRSFVYDKLPQEKNGFKYYRLGELVRSLEIYETITGYETVRRPGRYIRNSSLHDSYLSCVIDFDGIVDAPIPDTAYKAYADGGYATYVNGQIKIGQISGMYNSPDKYAFFDGPALLEEDEPYSNSRVIDIDRNVYHFAPINNGNAALDYILRELTSEYVLEQANKLAYGTVKREMRRYDFRYLKIAVPSIEQQDEILKKDRIKAVETANAKVNDINEKFRKDIHMVLHGLGQTVFNLGNWMGMLDYARKDGNGIINDNDEIGGLVKVKGCEIFDNINSALKTLSHQISSFDAGYHMIASTFSLTEYIDKYIASHKHPNVDYDFSLGYFASNDANGANTIEFPEDALQIILDCIITNAISHGFTDPAKKYTIKLNIEAQGLDYVLSISNNGEPLPSWETPESVFVWGETTGGKTHSGIGCYQIRNLMEEFGGRVEIVSTPSAEYAVTYKLTFTKTNLKN